MSDVLQQLQDLFSFGYTSVRRTFGGDFVVKSPTGRVVREADFAEEIEFLLGV